jgi:hypothetical protein
MHPFARAIGITGKTIHFSGAGVIGVSDQITDNIGKAVGNGTAPMTVSNNLQVKADFAGDNMFVGISGAISYKSLQHQTFLLLSISPDIQDPGNYFTVQGRLIDYTIRHPVDSKRVTFTSRQINLPDTLTDTGGIYKVENQVAPSYSGRYSIQSRFSGDELYSSTESPIEFLTVR